MSGSRSAQISMTASPVSGKAIPQYEAEGILGMAMPSVFALAARRLMETQGATIKDFAQVAVKAHNAGALNPASQSCQRTTIEQVVNSRMIADPITVLQCCPGTEGAAAIILCSELFRAPLHHQAYSHRCIGGAGGRRFGRREKPDID
jgi:benzoylsuccinyl-CoA thiolase BbsB subunit